MFCVECGASLEVGVPTERVAEAPAAPSAERRLVSVLFADLVGFTTLSEQRDSEEVRELLTRYFDTARQMIGRYGGTVEKFIGDAVMAVWGTPIAHEDDAERAVRAALDLVSAVAALGEEAGAPSLRLRAGVSTGEAAVTIGAEGQGMVAGDLVNTASRIQAAAQPGAVFVGDGTRRASEAAIGYEDVGEFELKGKTEPVPLWRALRVIAARKGEGRSSGLEAPFVGRDAEFRLVRELFHATADEGKARLVSVVGVAGIGKSRLAWEFEKYIDGLIDDVWWQRGRCLAYGEGVAYWALAEMVRMRARIAEDEPPDSAADKLRKTIEENVPDPEERVWIEPRLQHLLGLAERIAPDREDLFSAWRLFFERLAEQGPAILLFDDLQWADTALLDFIEYLLEWSRSYPLYVVTLARPELLERHSTWGAGKRNATSLFLEPLTDEAMDELLEGLAPGLPEELRTRIRERAEGVPLYAVETVRMLLDRGLLEKDGREYRLTGPVDALEVPETLHALIAARLDGLDPPEHRLLEDASVLGKTFTARALSAVAEIHEAELEPLLASLLRKEILTLQADPRSPERGQCGFLQALVQKVCYDTLARKERKARHLRVAAYFETEAGVDEKEIVEVIAAHYLEAYRADPDAEDAPAIKAKAYDCLARAGERAASLAASEEAQRYFLQAAEFADEPAAKAELFERAGEMAWAGGRGDTARTYFEAAIALFDAEVETHAAARVSAHLGEITWADGHIDEAVERMARSLEILSVGQPDHSLATLAAQLGRFRYFMGEPDRAAESIERALEMAEALWLPDVLSEALNTKGLILFTKGRPEEAMTLLKHSLQVGLQNDAPAATLRAYYNVSNLLYHRDRYEESLESARDGLALCKRLGNRQWEWGFLAEMVCVLFLTGSWDEALEQATEIPHFKEFTAIRFAGVELLRALPQLHAACGRVDEAAEVLAQFEDFADSADIQERTAFEAAQATVLRAQGKVSEALLLGQSAFEGRLGLGAIHPNVKQAFEEAMEAALALGDLDKAETLLAVVEDLTTGDITPFLRAQRMRFAARLAAARGEGDGVDEKLRDASSLFRRIGTPFWLGVSLLEQAEWAVEHGTSVEAEPLLAEAREIFERLRAQPWLERVSRAGASLEAAAALEA